MSVLIYLVPISLLLLGAAIWAFVWAVRAGQFDDLDTPPLDILAEDRREPRRQASNQADPEREDAG